MTKLATKTPILLIDAHQLLRTGIKQIIESEHSFLVVAESDGEGSIIDLIEIHTPSMVLMDIDLHGTDWRAMIKTIASNDANIKIVILTFNKDESSILEAVQLGVHGYLLKSMASDSLLEVIRHIHEGGTYLDPDVIHYVVSDYQRLLEERAKSHLNVFCERPLHILSRRECQVLQLLAEGNSNKSIAEKLGISQSTCKNHVNSILKKMNANDRTHAVVTAIRNGWVELKTANSPLRS